jgi:hypothetical protein
VEGGGTVEDRGVVLNLFEACAAGRRERVVAILPAQVVLDEDHTVRVLSPVAGRVRTLDVPDVAGGAQARRAPEAAPVALLGLGDDGAAAKALLADPPRPHHREGW